MNNFISINKHNLKSNNNNYYFNPNLKNNISPSLYKEWINFSFNYNKNSTIDSLIYFNFIKKLIKGYFTMNYKKNKSLSFNNIYISKPYIKFNNNKISITLFIFNREKFALLKVLLSRIINLNKIFKLIFIRKILLKKFIKEINNYKKLFINLMINKLKFHKNWLYLLSSHITNIYNKKIEFNIINIKNYRYNSDILTEILGLKIKNRKTNIMNLYRTILIKTIFYKKINNSNSKLLNFLFENISYKNLKGLSLLSKGRLTKRYKAARSIKLRNLIGGLTNTNYYNYNKTLYRNTINSNIEYTKHVNKRRIGAFAIKGWISGKN